MAALVVALPGLDPVAVMSWPVALIAAVEDRLRRQADEAKRQTRRR